MHPILLTPLHQLSIPNRVARDQHDLRLERHVDLLEHLHRVWPAALLLGVVEDVALLRDRALDHVEEDGAEGFFHVGSDPDEEPVVELHGRREHSANTRTGADGDTAAVEMGEVGQAGKLVEWSDSL